MPRFKLLIEYTGTRYSGWQIQKNARTVQGEIDRAVRDVSKRGEFELYGSGRTDAGVHALAQVASVDVEGALPVFDAARPPRRILGASAARRMEATLACYAVIGATACGVVAFFIQR